MNKVIYQDHKYIKTQEDYNKVKFYLEEYIIGLLGQSNIREKRSLIEVFNDLSKKGYIGSSVKQEFFKKLFNYELKHKGKNIDQYLLELRWFKTGNRTNTLNLV